jgi:hypothetical protein
MPQSHLRQTALQSIRVKCQPAKEANMSRRVERQRASSGTDMAAFAETFLHIAPLVILAGAGSIGLAALIDRLLSLNGSRDR